MILREAERVNEVGIDKLKCGCVNKSTHGLPYSCEIAHIIKERCLISLLVVHPHSVMLDMIKDKFNEISFELNIEAEIDSILK